MNALRLSLILLAAVAAACHPHDCTAPGTPGSPGACCIDGTFSDYCNGGLECSFPTYTCASAGGLDQRCRTMSGTTACDGELVCLWTPGVGHDTCQSCGHPDEGCCAGSCPYGGVCTPGGTCQVDDHDCMGTVRVTVETRSVDPLTTGCKGPSLTQLGDSAEEAQQCVDAALALRRLEAVEDTSDGSPTREFCLHRPFAPERGEDFMDEAWSEDDARSCAMAACGEDCREEDVTEGMCAP